MKRFLEKLPTQKMEDYFIDYLRVAVGGELGIISFVDVFRFLKDVFEFPGNIECLQYIAILCQKKRLKIKKHFAGNLNYEYIIDILR